MNAINPEVRDVGKPPILELRGLSKRYGKIEALSELSLSVREGEVYGFLGRNGAGKSTTIRIIMGITKPTSGEVILFGGGGPKRTSLVTLRQRIGYVAQEQNFYPWMTPLQLGRFVRGFYPTWDDGEFSRLLNLLELPLRRKTRTFSGGMKVKLALAIALAHRPKLLVLDEPTAGLDPVARREFLEMVRDQAAESGRTTFFSTHLVDEVEFAAQRIGILDGGRTLFEGMSEELLSRVLEFRCDVTNPALPPALPAPIADGVPNVRRLRDEIREGERRVVVVVNLPFDTSAVETSGWRASMLPLEEAFIELVRRSPRQEG